MERKKFDASNRWKRAWPGGAYRRSEWNCRVAGAGFARASRWTAAGDSASRRRRAGLWTSRACSTLRRIRASWTTWRHASRPWCAGCWLSSTGTMRLPCRRSIRHLTPWPTPNIGTTPSSTGPTTSKSVDGTYTMNSFILLFFIGMCHLVFFILFLFHYFVFAQPRFWNYMIINWVDYL